MSLFVSLKNNGLRFFTVLKSWIGLETRLKFQGLGCVQVRKITTNNLPEHQLDIFLLMTENCTYIKCWNWLLISRNLKKKYSVQSQKQRNIFSHIWCFADFKQVLCHKVRITTGKNILKVGKIASWQGQSVLLYPSVT